MSGGESINRAEPLPKAIDAEQYASWLPPGVAIKRLEGLLHEREAQNEIFQRICNGEVFCAARTVTMYIPGGTIEVIDYGTLGPFLWMYNGAPESYDLIWKTGTHTLSRPTGGSGSALVRIECFGIRL